MNLKKVQITDFQSVRDSTEYEIGDITCLVGKNESGKTALLQSLYRLNPIIPTHNKFSVIDDYPRWDVEDYRIAVERGERDPATVARAVFELEDDDVAVVAGVFGDSALPTRTLKLSKGYDEQIYFDFDFDEAAALRHLLDKHQFAPDAKAKLETCKTFPELLPILGSIEQTESSKELTALLQQVKKHREIKGYVFDAMLWPRVPKFLYFDEYYQMLGKANIEKLKHRQQHDSLNPSDYPLLGLINLARLNFDELIGSTRTRDLKNRLEGAGNHLTKRIVKYWSQNRYLELRFDVRPARPEDPEEMRDGTNIWADIYDTKHNVTTELGTRSRGFVWFFSFLAWYSDVQRRQERVILLLDEPGLSLHARAQEDLLRYFDAEVAPHHQIIYTTHSPFMVDPARFDRVRIVQDLTLDTEEELPPEKQGTKVLTDVLQATEDSLFPLQGALGYDLYQTLFIGPNNLVVEGVSDLLYLQTISAVLHRKGRTALSEKWTITPVGGSDKVPTFVALIGAQKKLNIAVLIDYQKKDKQIIENLYKKKLLSKKKVLTFADFLEASEADIEDMFDLAFYLRLVNEEFKASLAKPIEEKALDNRMPRILLRLDAYFQGNPLKEGLAFNHYRPARHFSENVAALEGEISQATLDRFEEIFKRVNALL